MFRREWLIGLICIVAIFIAGCGGNGSNGFSPVYVKFSVSWPTRARDFNAPKSASFAVLALTQNDVLKLSMQLNRDARTDAHAQTTISTTAIQKGDYDAAIVFYSGMSQAVASANLKVRLGSGGELLRADGTSLGAVGFGLAFTTLTVQSSPSVIFTGHPATVQIFGQTPTGDLVAVDTQGINVRKLSGTATVDLNSDAKLLGQTAGTVRADFEIDGVHSNPLDLSVVEERDFSVAASAIAINPANGNIIASTLPDATPPNAVVEIDANTGSILKQESLGESLGRLGVSADGKVIYVASNDPSHCRFFRLDWNALSAPVPISASPGPFYGAAQVWNIAVCPTNSEVVAVSFADAVASGHGNVTIVDHGVALPDHQGPYEGDELSWLNGSTLATVTIGLGPSTATISTVDANGLTATKSLRGTPFDYGVPTITLANNVLYGSSGARLSVPDLTPLGNIQPQLSTYDDAAYAPDLDRAVLLQYSSQTVDEFDIVKISDGTTIQRALFDFGRQRFQNDRIFLQRIPGTSDVVFVSGQKITVWKGFLSL